METRTTFDGVDVDMKPAVDTEPPDDMSVFKKIGDVINNRRIGHALAVGAVVGLSAGNIAFDRGGRSVMIV